MKLEWMLSVLSVEVEDKKYKKEKEACNFVKQETYIPS